MIVSIREQIAKIVNRLHCVRCECETDEPSLEYPIVLDRLESLISKLQQEAEERLASEVIKKIEQEELQSGDGFRHYNAGLTKAQDILASLSQPQNKEESL